MPFADEPGNPWRNMELGPYILLASLEGAVTAAVLALMVMAMGRAMAAAAAAAAGWLLLLAVGQLGIAAVSMASTYR